MDKEILDLKNRLTWEALRDKSEGRNAIKLKSQETRKYKISHNYKAIYFFRGH